MTVSVNGKRSLAILCSALPPANDAIGEYSACLAAALASLDCPTSILTSASSSIAPVSRVNVETSFTVSNADYAGLQRALVGSGAPSHILLQYNPFCWGKRGWAPGIVRALSNAKRANPKLKIGVMFHEVYMLNPGTRSWIMRCWQAPQFKSLVRLADRCFVSTDRWSAFVRRAGKSATLMPVGSNLPLAPKSNRVSRSTLGISDRALVCGAFGSTHPSRPWSWIGDALAALQRAGLDPVLLHIGADSQDVRAACKSAKVIACGRLEAADVSARFGVMDLFLSPLTDGLSARRSSVMAALQHGVATVSTRSVDTDHLFLAEPKPVALSDVSAGSVGFSQACIDLAENAVVRSELAASGQAFFQRNADWPVIASRLINEFVNAVD